MRTLDECKKEILRRSERKLKQLRTKRRIVICMVPIALCIVSWTFWNSMQNGLTSDGTTNQAPEFSPENVGFVSGAGTQVPDEGSIGNPGFILYAGYYQQAPETSDGENKYAAMYGDPSGKYTVSGDDARILSQIFTCISYHSHKVCRCPIEYSFVDASGAIYGINLDHGFVRCEKGQAEITEEQKHQLSQIIHNNIPIETEDGS